MRYELYKNIDEILDENIMVLLSHNGDSPMDWTPTRQRALFTLSGHFPNIIMELCDKVDYDVINRVRLNPSQFMKSAYKFQIISKSLPIPIEKVSSCYFFLCNCAVLMRKKIISESLKFYQIERKKFVFPNEDAKKIVSYLNADLRAYCEAIFCDDHTIGGEIIGPLDLNGCHMIVRDYHRLRPIEIQPFLEKVKVTRVQTFCLYDCEDIFIDLNGNLQCSQNMVEGLIQYCIKVTTIDGKSYYLYKYKDIKRLVDYFDKLLVEFMEYYHSLEDIKKNKLLVENEYYALQPIFDYANIDWKAVCFANQEYVVENEYISINKEKRKKLFEISDNIEKQKYARNMLDPRVKWI